MKKIIIILAVAVAAFGIGFGIGKLLVPSSSPMEKVEKAIEKNLTLTEKTYEDVGTGMTELANGGSVAVSGSLRSLMEEFIGIGVDVDGAVKLYFDGNNEAGLNLSVSSKGTTLSDLTVVADDSRVALTSDTLLGGEVYGTAFATFIEKFDDSIFGPDGAYSLGISSDDLSAIVSEWAGGIASAPQMIEQAAELEGTATDIIEDFKACVFASLGENADITVEKGSVTAEDETVDTTDVTVYTDGDRFFDLVTDVVGFFENNEKIGTMFSQMDAMLGEYSEYMDMSYTEIWEEADFSEILSSIAQTKAEVAKTGETISLTLVFHISKSEKTLIGVDFSFDYEDNGVSMSCLLAPSLANTEYLAATLDMREGGETREIMSVLCRVLENTDDAYRVAFAMETNEALDAMDMNHMSYTLDWNKESGALTLSIDIDEINMAFEGSLLSDKDKIVFEAESLTVDGESADLGGLQATVTYKDTMPVLGEYKDLLDMTEEEATGYLQDFMYLISSLVSIG